MASNFKFKILSSADPQAQYNAIATKDPMTFYLLNTGIGYLGTVKLFDATEDNAVIKNLVTDMCGEDFVADDVSTASTKAIVDYVAEKFDDIAAILTTSFFRHVESHTLSEADLANDAISVPDGCQAGDVGLLFTADTDGENGGETYYFIPLTDYLQNVYTPESSKSITMTISSDNKIKAELQVKAGEESIKVDEENGGVYIEKTATISEEAPSDAKLVTEASIVAYIKDVLMPAVNTTIQNALEDVVTAVIDDGSTEG